MDEIILSILTPGVPKRLLQIAELCEELQNQIVEQSVEHLVLIDNKRRTVGEKRDALLRAARGRYVAFVDDDDLVSPNYVARLLEASRSNPDVITFRQRVEYNDLRGEVEFRLGHHNEAFNPHGGITRRNAWHVCAWRRKLAILSAFPAINYGEDWAFSAKLCALPNLREEHIAEVLHTYRHSSSTTEAPPPLTPSL